MKKKLRIAFAWGGTGGHVTPISSLIEYAHTDQEIMNHVEWLYWFGTKGKLEHKFADEIPWVQFVPIQSWKLRRERSIRSTLENLRDVAYFNAWYMQSLYLLQQHKIDVLFCKGWYVALPVSLAAASLRIPIIVHESDSSAWLVNKIVSKVSKKNFEWFGWVLKNSRSIGQILSPSLLKANHDIELFQWDDNKKVVLVICWSQGSKAIFERLIHDIDKAWQVVKSLHFVVILWLLNSSFKKTFEDHLQVTTFDFLDAEHLAWVYSQTDIAICRGSATTLAELEYFNIPKVIIPLSTHDQPLNAKRYAQYKGDIVVGQENMSQMLEAVQYHSTHLRETKSQKEVDFFAPHRTVWEALLD